MRTLTRRLTLAAAVALAAAAPAASLHAQQRARIASPRDTTRATVAGARLLVDYGRPSKRGRDIFPGLQPYGQVWRLGANEATHFTTSREIMIGDKRIPAGRYTLYAIPDSTRWTLVVNKQTGQWGTTYTPSQDLVRIPMTVRYLKTPVETLTVAITPGRPRAAFVVRWDDVEATAPITVPTAGSRK
ncbi:MAG: DUF2911 domain-containing protein [Gemmatimonadaceae bacterium]